MVRSAAATASSSVWITGDAVGWTASAPSALEPATSSAIAPSDTPKCGGSSVRRFPPPCFQDATTLALARYALDDLDRVEAEAESPASAEMVTRSTCEAYGSCMYAGSSNWNDRTR